MRPRNLLLLPVLAALSASALAGCSSDTATTATGPAAESTTSTAAPAPPQTADPALQTGTTVPSSTTTTVVSVAPPTTKAPVTTRKPAPTTAKPTPTTKAPVPTTAKPVPTTRVKAPAQFCEWAKLMITEDKSVPFPQYAKARYEGTVAVRPFVPGEIGQDYNVILAAYEQINPAIESGEITSAIGATQWYARNDPGMYDQLVAAAQHVGAYRRTNC